MTVGKREGGAGGVMLVLRRGVCGKGRGRAMVTVDQEAAGEGVGGEGKHSNEDSVGC